ncbi:MAG: T9SS type A sorting domain-containing protein [Taibaiella sp.]|nr:T9SS type A sorting domain-containing protein [Taibaiella sp.]
MNKLLLFTISICLSISGFSQPVLEWQRATVQDVLNESAGGMQLTNSAKPTATGDTVYITHINTSAGMDTIVRYFFAGDTGEVFGINAFEVKGYCERYDVLPATATYQVIGVRAKFGGTVNASSTKTVDFHVWRQGSRSEAGRPTLFYNGLPETSLTTETVPITQLGIGMSPGEGDTTKNHFFTYPTSFLLDSFFIGYTIDYSWASLGGDTIGLYSNQDAERTEAAYYVVSSADTTINVVNASMTHTGEWFDNGTTGYGPFANLCVYPIVVIGGGITGLPGISQGHFTFRGSAPNPASNSTTIRYALDAKADVTIEVTDMAGREVYKAVEKAAAAGEHETELNTSAYAPGTYIYTIYTSAGDGIASQLIIAN